MSKSYTIKEEKFSEANIEEFKSLFEEHWKEIATDQTIKLNPNYDQYIQLCKMGLLHSLIVRTKEGKVIGYTFTFLTPHMHYQDTIYAQNDIIYIHPDYRKGGLGIRLIKEFEKQLYEKGANVLHLHVKVSNNFGPLLERLGYFHEESVYRKRIR
jgi:GNAT superfamily N-acetyltransferase